MTMTEMRDVDEIADELLPVDGPHTEEGVRAAAGLISELVRRLNHATFPGQADRTLPFPSTVDAVVGRLRGAAGGLPQLCAQLARRLRDLADDPALYDDRYQSAPAPPGVTAEEAAEMLHGSSASAGRIAAELAQRLGYVRRDTTHLGLADGQLRERTNGR